MLWVCRRKYDSQAFGKISKIKSFETIINDSNETSVWIGNWLTATSVFSLDVSPKYPWRHKKSWKHKTKLTTKTGSWPDFRIDTNYMSDNTGLRKKTMRAYLMKYLDFSSWNQNHLSKGKRCFASPQTCIPGSKDLRFVPKRKWYHHSSASKMLIWELTALVPVLLLSLSLLP